MTPDLQKEFRLLSEKAKQQLKDVPESGSYRHVFSFWAFPSFSPSFRCTLYSPRRLAKERLPFASYTIWRSDLDAEKLRSPVERLKYPKDLDPTIEGDTVWLTEDLVNGIEQRIQGIAIPIYLGPPQVAGCDGTGYEFHYNALFYGASIHWWEDLPIEWRPFTNIITRIIEELQERRKKQAHNSASAANPPPGP